MNARRVVVALVAALVMAFGGCVFRPITNPPGATGGTDLGEPDALSPTAGNADDAGPRAADGGDAGDAATDGEADPDAVTPDGAPR